MILYIGEPRRASESSRIEKDSYVSPAAPKTPTVTQRVLEVLSRVTPLPFSDVSLHSRSFGRHSAGCSSRSRVTSRKSNARSASDNSNSKLFMTFLRHGYPRIGYVNVAPHRPASSTPN